MKRAGEIIGWGLAMVLALGGAWGFVMGLIMLTRFALR